MKSFLAPLTLAILQISVICIVRCEECEKPNDLKAKEEYCWKAEVEIIDRLQYTSKNVLNFAKKKLGIGQVEEVPEPQKCNYYQCIFQKLQLVNPQGYPIYDTMVTWIQENVIYAQATNLMDQLNICNEGLTNATSIGYPFNGNDPEGLNSTSEADNKPQTGCDIALEFTKCLSHQKGCPIFEFP